MSKINWADEVWLITGATSGLGRAMALRAGELRSTVAIVGRNGPELQNVCREIGARGGKGYEYRYDLTDFVNIPSLIDRIKKETGKTISVLANCAGYNAPGFISDMPIEEIEKNYRVNTLAPIALIQHILPCMIEKKHGVVANIMSAAMYRSFPGMSSYCSSKIALGAFHESLEAELSGTEVKTLYVNPGAFSSRYFENMKVFGALRDHKFTCKAKDGMKTPEYVAKKIINAIDNGMKRLDLSTRKDIVAKHLNYWAPKFIEKMIIKSNKELLKYAMGNQQKT